MLNKIIKFKNKVIKNKIMKKTLGQPSKHFFILKFTVELTGYFEFAS